MKAPGGKEEDSERYFSPEAKTASPAKKEKEMKEEDIIVPLTEDRKEHFLTKNRKALWFVIFSLLLSVFCLVLKKNFFTVRDKNPLKTRIKKDLIKVNQAIKERQWKTAGIEMSHIMYSFFSELSEKKKVVKNWDVLFEHIHPSIRVKYEDKIRNLVSRLERLSFASSDEARKFRNKKNVERLKRDLIFLIEKIFNEYF